MEYNKKMINRIHRIQGQLNGVIKMMEEEKNCKDVISQLSASKSSIQRLMGIIISENLVAVSYTHLTLPTSDLV